MAKTKYWMTDGYGHKALIEGAEERDRWKPLGWYETDEPAGDDRVWLRHEEHGGRAMFPAAVVGLWEAKGWHPSDPPAAVSPFNAEDPADVVETAPPPAPAPTAGPAGKTTVKERTDA